MSKTSTISKIEKLRQRHYDGIRGETVLGEGIEKSAAHRTDGMAYLLRSAAALPHRSTEISLEEAQRIAKCVQSHLPGITIRYQGSVITNTHIAFHSDVDVLAVTDKFYTVLPPLTVDFPYYGDPVFDLRQLREQCARAIGSTFYACNLELSGGKCVSVSGGSLRRKVDVVPANWLDTPEYVRTGKEAFRGVMILDAAKNDRVTNYPFLHAARLDEKDAECRGYLKPQIRVIKSILNDADEQIDVSSYDVCALCFAIPTEELRATSGDIVRLCILFSTFALRCLQNHALRDALVVPNGTRKVFADDGVKTGELLKLVEEVIFAVQEAQTTPSIGVTAW